MSKHNIGDLRQMQSLPLRHKVTMTKHRLKGWYDNYDGMVYLAFSGGKDSTVLADIIMDMGLDIPFVFVDTGLEYPEIREFVRSYGDRVTWVKPKLTFKQVIEKYGYPFISKEVAEAVYGAKRYLTKIAEQLDFNERTNERLPYAYRYEKLTASGRYSLPARNVEGGQTTSTARLWVKENIPLKDQPLRLARLEGKYNEFVAAKKQESIPEGGERSRFNCSRYAFLLDAPFDVSNLCCNVMKKNPSHRYAKETGRKPITAQMADESRLRLQQWLNNGCNGFDMKSPISNPMAFWTEQDVLLYIKQHNLPICSVYGDVIECDTEIHGQMSLSDYDADGMLCAESAKLTTTGCKRTGCMFCGFGCHRRNDDRFVRMKETHPKQYDYIMRPKEQGGLNYKEVIDWINENGDLHILY